MPLDGIRMEEKETRLFLYKRDDIRRFVSWLLKARDDIRPQRDPDGGGYIYPGLESTKLLLELESNGILEKYAVGTVPSCTGCQHSNFHVDYVCPFSQHHNLERGTMIEHYACGHTDFEYNYNRSGNELICPKCRRILKLIGTDYRKIGQLYHCSGCARFFGTPLIELTCRMCGKVIKQDEASLETVYGYRIRPELRGELMAHCTLETQIMQAFKRSGFEVTIPKIVRGISGIDHTFDMHVLNEDLEIVIDLVSATTELAPKDIAEFFAKVYDTKPQKAVLIAMPKLSQDAQKLSAMYGVETIFGERIDEILEGLSVILKLPIDVVNRRRALQWVSPTQANPDQF